jgi:hypothetical protein
MNPYETLVKEIIKSVVARLKSAGIDVTPNSVTERLVADVFFPGLMEKMIERKNEVLPIVEEYFRDLEARGISTAADAIAEDLVNKMREQFAATGGDWSTARWTPDVILQASFLAIKAVSANVSDPNQVAAWFAAVLAAIARRLQS